MGYFACTSHATHIHTRITSNERVISFFIGASYFVLLLCQPAIRLLLISAFWTFRRNTRTLFRSRSRSDTLFLSHSHLILFHTEFLLLFIDSSSVCQHLWMPPPTSYAVAIAAAAMVTTITHFQMETNRNCMCVRAMRALLLCISPHDILLFKLNPSLDGFLPHSLHTFFSPLYVTAQRRAHNSWTVSHSNVALVSHQIRF